MTCHADISAVLTISHVIFFFQQHVFDVAGLKHDFSIFVLDRQFVSSLCISVFDIFYLDCHMRVCTVNFFDRCQKHDCQRVKIARGEVLHDGQISR